MWTLYGKQQPRGGQVVWVKTLRAKRLRVGVKYDGFFGRGWQWADPNIPSTPCRPSDLWHPVKPPKGP